jgi:hypothetical protein
VRQEALAPLPGSLILWGDWERCQIRRSFLTLLRTQTVTVTQCTPEDRNVEGTEGKTPAVLTRAQLAHWRQPDTATDTQCLWCFYSCFDDHCAQTALCFCSAFRLPFLCFFGGINRKSQEADARQLLSCTVCLEMRQRWEMEHIERRN